MRPIRTLVAGLASLSLLLAACSSVPGRSGAGTEPAPTPTAPGPIVTIKIAGLDGPWVDALISGFYETFPGYRIERVTFQPQSGQDYSAYLKQQLTEGAVDVVSVGGFQDTTIKDGLILPLEPFIQKAKFDLKPYGPTLDQLKYEGKLYSLPYSIDPQVMLYNPDLFQSAGVPLPKDGWTWEDFRLAAAKIAKGDGDGKVWGFFNNSGDSIATMYVHLKTGYAGPFAPDGDMKEALQFFRTMILSDKSMPQPEKHDYRNPSRTSGRWIDFFGEGKAGMMIDNLTSVRFRGQSKFKAAVAPMPTAQGGQSMSYVYPEMMGIAAGSKQAQGAWEFLHYAAGPQGGQQLAKQGLLPLYRTDDVKKAWFAQQPTPSAATEFLFTATFAVPTPDSVLDGKRPKDGQAQQVQEAFGRLNNAINGALVGDLSVDDAIHDYTQAQDDVRKLYQ